MISQAHIKNFKSIRDLKLTLGRVTVLIGENGSGKSNILEALALASAASQDKLDNEFLFSRGIRVTEPQFMHAAFAVENAPDKDEISLEVEDSAGVTYEQVLISEGDVPYPMFRNKGEIRIYLPSLKHAFESARLKVDPNPADASAAWLSLDLNRHLKSLPLPNFLVYSPENTALRDFEKGGQILPLGIKGEGLFKLLKVLSIEDNGARLQEIKDNLRLIDWFGDLSIPTGQAPFEQALQIRDRYLREDLAGFDQRSANEGFLFLLFYFALFVSKETPACFAIDNIDASLNPKLCGELMRRVCALAQKHEKQVILTTHNPAVLDGLNLHDEEQRLLVVYRNSQGHTRARRVGPPEPIAGEPPVKLSEAFLRGLIGGLPENF